MRLSRGPSQIGPIFIGETVIIDDDLLEEIRLYLLEMAAMVPYDRRTIKGSEARQKAALEILKKLQVNADREKGKL